MIDLSTEQQTRRLGVAIAERAQAGDVIALHGDLGAGKTTLARGFIQHLTGSAEEVVSPTFTLVQLYDAAKAPIFHFDLYRLTRPEDVLELGLEDALGEGICLIEWPERMGHFLPARRLDVTLSVRGDARRAILSGEAWKDRIADIGKDVEHP